jgi:hypothetical protein
MVTFIEAVAVGVRVGSGALVADVVAVGVGDAVAVAVGVAVEQGTGTPAARTIEVQAAKAGLPVCSATNPPAVAVTATEPASRRPILRCISYPFSKGEMRARR